MNDAQKRAAHRFIQEGVAIAQYWVERAYGPLPPFKLVEEPTPSTSKPPLFSSVTVDPREKCAVVRYNPRVIDQWFEEKRFSHTLCLGFNQLVQIYQQEPRRRVDKKTWEQLAIDDERDELGSYRLWTLGGGLLASVILRLNILQIDQLQKELFEQSVSWSGSQRTANEIFLGTDYVTEMTRIDLRLMAIAGAHLSGRDKPTLESLGLWVDPRILTPDDLTSTLTLDPQRDPEDFAYWGGAYLCAKLVKRTNIPYLLRTPYSDDQLKALA